MQASYMTSAANSVALKNHRFQRRKTLNKLNRRRQRGRRRARVAWSDTAVRNTAEQNRRLEKTDAAIRAVSAEPETYRYGRKNFRWGASCKNSSHCKADFVPFWEPNTAPESVALPKIVSIVKW